MFNIIKIEFHYTYIIMAIIFILAGYYLNLLAFTSLIIIHELGHYIIAKIQKIKVTKIIIYPYGGLTKIDDIINQNINKELLVAISGIIFQSIYFMIITYLNKKGIIRNYTYNIFRLYNKELIYFNLLPIYPLDGSKILMSVLEKNIPFLKSKKIVIIVSIINLIILFVINMHINNYSYTIIIGILTNYIYKLYKNLDYIYNRFLLERHLYKIEYKRIKVINNYKKMYKNRTHIIKNKNKYEKELIFLNNMFDLNKKV